LQPCSRLDGMADQHPLWILNKLSNDDKHRVPNVVRAFSANTKLRIDDVDVGVVLTLSPPRLKSNTPMLFENIPTNLKPGMAVKSDSTFTVGFEDAGPWRDRPVNEVISAILNFIKDFVLPRFEPFFN
jgi:hypothetical protein